MEDVAIRQRGLAFEMRQGRVDAGQKRIVLQPLHDCGSLALGDVAEIAPRFEIAKGIKRHGRPSRR